MRAESELPYLTSDSPGVPFVARAQLEDFFVEELPAYAPSGEGDHVYFEIEKRGLSTHEAVRRIAGAFDVAPREIGCAGLKDARGVTRQTLSLEHIDPARLSGLEMAQVKILSTSRHTNKLKRGHLLGNRFVLRLRDRAGSPSDSGSALLEREGDLRKVLEQLEREGLPNYFGPQRFGLRGDNWRIGKALLAGDAAEAAAWIAGRPEPGDSVEIHKARELFESGDYQGAARAWPGNFRAPVLLARAMARNRGRAGKALRSVGGEDLRFCVSAYQSHLFNRVVAERLRAGTLSTLLLGDLAWRHAGGAVFRVEDLDREAGRAASFEVSPSGPLFGHRMTRPEGEPDRIETSVLATEGQLHDDFEQRSRYQWKGARRPLRVPLAGMRSKAGEDEHGPYLELGFELPSGSYATALLRELAKDA